VGSLRPENPDPRTAAAASRECHPTASTISIVELLRSDWTGGISAGVAWLVFLQVERRLPPEPTDTQS
jgi:hypothetical protein